MTEGRDAGDPTNARRPRGLGPGNAGSIEVELTADDLARIDVELPQPAGEGYDEVGMAAVDL